MSQVVVIGVGNEFRGDDGAGRMVARELAGRQLPGVKVCESSGEALSLMELWGDAEKVILADAAESGEAAGSVSKFDASSEALPSETFHCSTHAFSVAEAIEMARALGQLPGSVIVYGIEGASYEHGSEISEAARKGVAEAVVRIEEEVAAR